MCLANTPVFSQAYKEPQALNLPGNNLDLYAALFSSVGTYLL